MVARGARYLIVPSRSGAVSDVAVAMVAEAEGSGVVIKTPKCDVSSYDSLAEMLKGYKKTMPRIRGCINCSLVLQVCHLKTGGGVIG